ncbi:MAG: cupin domain-containing protein [Deltaproteobacteria bacterium]|nr:cupin domain-containing protein [Deltaproteobacteria bacterium]
MNEPVIRPIDAHPPVNVLGESVRVLHDGTYAIFEQSGPAGVGPPPHQHPWDEAYLVTEGAIEVLLDGQWRACPAGTFVHVPGGTVHAYRGLTPRSTFFSITTRGNAAQMFVEMDREVGTPPDFGRAFEVAARAGLVIPPEVLGALAPPS